MRKLKKAYFSTPNLIFAFGQSLDRILPVMLENLIMAETGASFFYRNGFEVDFLLAENGSLVAIEAKKKEKSVKQLRKLSRKLKNVRKSFIVTLEEEGNIDNIPIIPAWKFILLRPYRA